MIAEQIPAFGRQAWMLNAGMQLHRVPHAIVMASLRDGLWTFYPDGWFACVMFADGRGVMTSDGTDRPLPPNAVRDLLLRVAIALNRTLHHDGHWVVLTVPDDEIAMVWRDADGDLRFTVDISNAFEGMTAGDFCQQAEAGYLGWRERMRLVEARSRDTIKRAQGEQSRAKPH